MSAPRRRRPRGVATTPARTRHDLVIASIGSAVVVFGTIFLIWGLRPGGFTAGSGGILHRQPRVSWWVILTLFALGSAVWVVKRPRARFRSPRKVLTACIAGVLVVSIVVFALWQASGGILRHYAPPVDFSLPSTSVPAPTVPASTATTTAGSTGAGSTAPGSTTASDSTPSSDAATTVPTTAAP